MLLTATARPEELSSIRLKLSLRGLGSLQTTATVVRLFEGAFAVSIDSPPQEILSALKAKQPEKEASTDRQTTVWDRIRALPYAEKIILATKADRSERAVLMQETDAQVLYYLLKNPRISTEEVLRIARSTSISASVADQIAKTSQWASNQEIRSAIVNNPRTPVPLALKLLPTLPEPEIRQIAKSGAVNQALKQAALRIVVSRS
jgi:hypothetical protein